jgi:hypothetical protein
MVFLDRIRDVQAQAREEILSFYAHGYLTCCRLPRTATNQTEIVSCNISVASAVDNRLERQGLYGTVFEIVHEHIMSLNDLIFMLDDMMEIPPEDPENPPGYHALCHPLITLRQELDAKQVVKVIEDRIFTDHLSDTLDIQARRCWDGIKFI